MWPPHSPHSLANGWDEKGEMWRGFQGVHYPAAHCQPPHKHLPAEALTPVVPDALLLALLYSDRVR